LGASNSKFKIQNLEFKITFWRKQFKIQNLEFKIFEKVFLRRQFMALFPAYRIAAAPLLRV
jgi:hypothetical protein